LFKLVKILNKREKLLDYVVDRVRYEGYKFSLYKLEFVDALLDQFYDGLHLSDELRMHRKLHVSLAELIAAVIYGFKCQNNIFDL